MRSLPWTLIAGSGLGYRGSSWTQVGPLLESQPLGQAQVSVFLNVTTGNTVVEDPLCQVVEGGRLLPLQFVYNSRVADPKRAWRLAADKRLRDGRGAVATPASETLVITEACGYEATYRRLGDWFASESVGTGVLVHQADGWRWHAPEGKVYAFDRQGQVQPNAAEKTGPKIRLILAGAVVSVQIADQAAQVFKKRGALFLAPRQAVGTPRVFYDSDTPSMPWVWTDPATGERERYNVEGLRVQQFDQEGRRTEFRALAQGQWVITGHSGRRYELRQAADGRTYEWYESQGAHDPSPVLLHRYVFTEDGLLQHSQFANGYAVRYAYAAQRHALSAIDQSDGSHLSLKHKNDSQQLPQVSEIFFGEQEQGIRRFIRRRPDGRIEVTDTVHPALITVDAQDNVTQVEETVGYDEDHDELLMEVRSYGYTRVVHGRGQLAWRALAHGGREDFDYEDLTGLLRTHQGANGQHTRYYYRADRAFMDVLVGRVETVGTSSQLTQWVYDYHYANDETPFFIPFIFLRFVLSPTHQVTESISFKASDDRLREIRQRDYAHSRFSRKAPPGLPPLVEEMEDWVRAQQKAQAPVAVQSQFLDRREQVLDTIGYATADPETGEGVVDLGVQVHRTRLDRSGNVLSEHRLLQVDLDAKPAALRSDDPAPALPVAGDYARSDSKWDGLHRLQMHMDPLKQTTHYHYDDAARLYEEHRPNGWVQRLWRNRQMGVTRLEQTAQSDDERQKRMRNHRFRVGMGEPIETKHPDGHVEYTFYDRMGRPTITVNTPQWDPQADTLLGLTRRVIRRARRRHTQTIVYAHYLDLSAYREGLEAGRFPATDMVEYEIEEQRLAEHPDNQVHDALYDASNRLCYAVTTIGDPREAKRARKVVAYEYDTMDRRVRTIAYADPLTEADYQTLLTEQSLDRDVDVQRDRVNRTFYTAEGMVLAEQDVEGYVTHYYRDAHNRVVEQVRYWNTSPLGQQDWPQVLPKLHPLDAHHFYFYDGLSQMVLEVDAGRYVTTRTFGAHGQEVRRRRYAERVSLDWFDQQRPHTRPDAPADSNMDEWVASMYDAKLRLVKEIHANGKVSEFTYDEMDQLVKTSITTQSSAFDPMNVSIEPLSAATDPDRTRKTALNWDAWGQVTMEANAFVCQSMAQANIAPEEAKTSKLSSDGMRSERAEHHIYEPSGLRIRTVQRLEVGVGVFADLKWVTYYDAWRRPVVQIAPDGAVVRLSYHPLHTRPTTTMAYVQVLSESQYATLQGGWFDATLDALLNTLQDPNNDRVETVTLNRQGLPLVRLDPSEFEWTTHYNVFDESVVSTEPAVQANQSIQQTWQRDVKGRIQCETRAAGLLSITTSNVYAGPQGWVVESVDPLGATTQRHWNRLGFLQRVQTPEQTQALCLETDAWGRPLTQTFPDGAVERHQYDRAQRMHTRNYPLEGTYTTHVFNVFGERVLQWDGLEHSRRFAHAPDGQVQVETDGLGRQTRWRYNDRGWPLEKIDPDGLCTHWRYNLAGHVLERIEDVAHLRLLTAYRRDAFGQAIEETNVEGVRIERTFNRQGVVVSEVFDPSDRAATGLALTTHSQVNAHGDVVLQQKGDARDPNQWVKQWIMDPLNRSVAEVIDPKLNPDNQYLALTTQRQRDAKGRVVAFIDAKGQVRYDVYDARDNTVFSIDASGAVKAYGYDDLDRRRVQRVYARRLDLNQWSAPPSRACVEAALTDSPQDTHTYYYVDANGRECFVLKVGVVWPAQTPVAQVTERAYDLAGRVVMQRRYARVWRELPTDLAHWTLDQVARQAQRLVDPKQDRSQHWVYDAADQECFHFDSDDGIHETTYDARGRVITKHHYAQEVLDKADLAQRSVTWLRAHLLKVEADKVTQFFYQRTAQLNASVAPKPAVAEGTVFDKPTFLISPNGLVHEFIYDAKGRLLENRQYEQDCDPHQSRQAIQQFLSESVLGKSAVRVKRNEWDRAGRKRAVMDAADFRETFERNALGVLQVHTDRSGHLTHFDIDRAQRQVTEYRPAAPTVSTVLTQRHLTLHHLGEQRLVIRKTLDANDNPVTIRYGEQEAQRMIIHELDPTNRAVGHRVPNVEVDDPNQRASFESLPLQETEQVLRTHTDGRGLVISERLTHGHWQFDVYDGLQRKVFAIASDGAVFEYGYNAFDEIEEKRAYVHRVVFTAQELEQFKDDGVPLAWLAEKLTPDPNDRLTHFERDKKGRTVLRRLPSITVYNARTRQLFATSQPWQQQTFDVFGHCVRQREPLFPDAPQGPVFEMRRWFSHDDQPLCEIGSVQLSVNGPVVCRAKRFEVNVFGEQVFRREYAQVLPQLPPLSATLSEVDVLLASLACDKDKVRSYQYDARGLLTARVTHQAVCQTVTYAPPNAPLQPPQMADLPAQDWVEQYSYTPMEQRSLSIGSDGLTRYRYYNAANQVIADVGVPKPVSEADGRQTQRRSATLYYVNVHGQRLGECSLAQGVVGPVDEKQTPEWVFSQQDEWTLFSMDRRGLMQCSQLPDGTLTGHTHTLSSQPARQWHWSQGYENVGREVDHLDERRTRFDARDRAISQITLRNHEVVRAEHQQLDALGDAVAQVYTQSTLWPVTPASSWPIQRRFMGEHFVWLSNEGPQGATLSLYNARGEKTLALTSGTRNLMEATRAQLPELLNDERVETTVWINAPQGGVLEHSTQVINPLPDGIEGFESDVQVRFDASRSSAWLSWAKQSMMQLTPHCFLWREGEAPGEYPIQDVDESRQAIELAQPISDRYHYALRYRSQTALTTEINGQDLYEMTGVVGLISETDSGSQSLLVESVGPCRVRLRGRTEGLLNVDLYQGDTCLGEYKMDDAGEIDLSDQRSGAYQFLPHYADEDVADKTFVFSIYTARASRTPLSRSLYPQAMLQVARVPTLTMGSEKDTCASDGCSDPDVDWEHLGARASDGSGGSSDSDWEHLGARASGGSSDSDWEHLGTRSMQGSDQSTHRSNRGSVIDDPIQVFGYFAVWDSLPADYQRHPMILTVYYHRLDDEDELGRVSLEVKPGEYLDDFPSDRFPEMKRANVRLPEVMGSLLSVTVSVQRGDRPGILDQVLLYDSQEPEADGSLFFPDAAVATGEQASESPVMYRFSPRQLVLLEPLPLDRDENVFFLDRSLGRQAEWMQLTAVGGTLTGWVFDVTHQAPGVYSYQHGSVDEGISFLKEESQQWFTVMDPTGQGVFRSAPARVLPEQPLQESHRYSLDVWGQVASKTTATGDTTNYARNHADQLTQVVLPAMTLYDDQGHPYPARVLQRFGYNQVGDEIGRTNGNGHTQVTVVNAEHQTIGRVLGDGTWSYHQGLDMWGRVRFYQDSADQIWETRYAGGYPVWARNPVGGLMHREFTAGGRMIRWSVPEGAPKFVDHDVDGMVTLFYESDGRFVATQFDVRGMPVLYHDSDRRVFRIVRDAFGEVASQVDWGGNSLVFERDFKRQVVRQAGALTNPQRIFFEIRSQKRWTWWNRYTYFYTLQPRLNRGQCDQRYRYSGGRLIELVDVVHGRRVLYGYDADGSRTGLSIWVGDRLVRSIRSRLDPLKRLIHSQDGVSLYETGFSASGFRVMQHAVAQGVGELRYSVPDAAGRAVIDQGVRNADGRIDLGPGKGVMMTYAHGRRATERRWIKWLGIVETQINYDPLGRIHYMKGSQRLEVIREYAPQGWLSRLFEHGWHGSQPYSMEQRWTLTASGVLTRQTSHRDGRLINTTVFLKQDRQGRPERQHTNLHDEHGSYYDLWTAYFYHGEGAQARRVHGEMTNNHGKTGADANSYFDSNGHLRTQMGLRLVKAGGLQGQAGYCVRWWAREEVMSLGEMLLRLREGLRSGEAGVWVWSGFLGVDGKERWWLCGWRFGTFVYEEGPSFAPGLALSSDSVVLASFGGLRTGYEEAPVEARRGRLGLVLLEPLLRAQTSVFSLAERLSVFSGFAPNSQPQTVVYDQEPGGMLLHKDTVKTLPYLWRSGISRETLFWSAEGGLLCSLGKRRDVLSQASTSLMELLSRNSEWRGEGRVTQVRWERTEVGGRKFPLGFGFGGWPWRSRGSLKLAIKAESVWSDPHPVSSRDFEEGKEHSSLPFGSRLSSLGGQGYTVSEPGKTLRAISQDLYGEEETASLLSVLTGWQVDKVLPEGTTLSLPQVERVQPSRHHPHYLQVLSLYQEPLIPHLEAAQPPPRRQKKRCKETVTRIVIGVIAVAGGIAFAGVTFGGSVIALQVLSSALMSSALSAGLQGGARQLNLLDEFSWTDVILTGISGATGAYFKGEGIAQLAFEKGIVRVAAAQGVSNLSTQLLQISLGHQQNLSFRSFIASVGSGVIGYSLPASLELKGDDLAWAQMVSNYGSEFLGQWIRGETISLETIGLSLLSTGVGLGVQAALSALETKMNNASGGASQSEGVESRKEGGQSYTQVEDEAYGEGVSAGQGKAQGHEHAYMELDVYEHYDEQGRLVYRRTSRVYEDGQGNRWVHEEEWNRGLRNNGLTPEPEGTPRPSWSGGQGDSGEGGRSQVSASPRHGLQGSSVRELSPEGQLRLISEPEYGTLKAVEAPKYKDHMADIWSRDIPLLQKIELSAKMTVFGDDPWRWNGVPGHFQQPSTFGSELRGFGKELLNMGLTAWDVVTGYSGLAPQFSISPSEIDGANAAKMLPVVGIFGRASKAGGAVNAPKIEGPTTPYKLGPATAQEVNASFKGMRPPYDTKIRPRTFELQNDKGFVRVHGEDNQMSKWMVRSKEIEGLTPRQIQEKLALPKTPVYISDVEVPTSITMRVGRAGFQKGWGAGGGMQYEVLSPVQKHWFKKPMLLEEQFTHSQRMR
ncbi:MAG: hypothetical protein GKR77_00530 [Legionellales bacterium]|nr:hypothetical protein [Legionellales bacterium]